MGSVLRSEYDHGQNEDSACATSLVVQLADEEQPSKQAPALLCAGYIDVARHYYSTRCVLPPWGGSAHPSAHPKLTYGRAGPLRLAVPWRLPRPRCRWFHTQPALSKNVRPFSLCMLALWNVGCRASSHGSLPGGAGGGEPAGRRQRHCARGCSSCPQRL